MLEILIPVILLIIVIFIVLIFFSYYNRIIRLENRIDNSWAQIDVQLNRRANLIPNLMETVKGYMKHEKETLENVTKARTALMNAKSPQENIDADNMLTGALKTLFAVAENYPDLKANVNFLELQRELSDTENKIQAARRFYNGLVMKLNTSVESFPSNVIASIFKFQKEDFFGIPEEEKEVVDVDFSSSPKPVEEEIEPEVDNEAEKKEETEGKEQGQ